MSKNGLKLMLSKSINRLGDVLYDYGNSSWLASFGQVGKSYLGIYQLVDVLISIMINPFGGVFADRLKRRKILLYTDALSAIVCLLISFISSDKLLVYGLIGVNIILAISSAFSAPSYRSFVPEVIKKEELLSYNARLETIVQVIKVSSPILGLVVYSQLGIHPTLVLDSLTFFLSFLFLYMINETETEVTKVKKDLTVSSVLKDMVEGLAYIRKEKEIFFLLVLASVVNLFIAMMNYVFPFTPHLFSYKDAYASLLSASAIGSILAGLVGSKVKSSMNMNLILLSLSAASLFLLTLVPAMHFPILFAYLGNLLFELFLTIFNIHFFSQVQERVDKAYMGRVIASIYTIACLLMPIGIGAMLIIPHSISIWSFSAIASALILVVIGGKFYYQSISSHSLKKEKR